MLKVSILDLVPVGEDYDIKEAFKISARYAQEAEKLGYERFWVAEHHNSESIASSATSVVISHLASQTKHIRVGAGGIMLPNHSPLIIAEQFGTLESLFPGRIDLGLGRAPGTDPRTVMALRRSSEAAGRFPQDVMELKQYFSPENRLNKIRAIPGEGCSIPLWILGSSTFGAYLAAHLGLPYAFASHFAPDALFEALEIYQADYQASPENPKPYCMIGINICCASTDEEAKHLFTSRQMSFTDLRRGTLKRFKRPIEDIETYWSPEEKILASQMLKLSFVGSKSTVKVQLKNFLSKVKVDEFMAVSAIYDENKKFESLRIFKEIIDEINQSE